MSTTSKTVTDSSQVRKANIEAIRAALIKGEKSGEPQPFDGDLFKREMMAKHSKED